MAKTAVTENQTKKRGKKIKIKIKTKRGRRDGEGEDREGRGDFFYFNFFIFLPVVGEDDEALEEAVAARGAAAESGEAELGGDEGEAAPPRRPHPILQLLHLVLDLRRPYAVVPLPRRHGLPRSEPSARGSDDRERAAPARPPPRNVVRVSMALDRSVD